MRRVSPRTGFRVTVRDREIARWIGRVRMVTAAQVADRFGLGRAVGYARLSGLVKLGLLEHAQIFHAMPGVYLTTRAGLLAVDLTLPPARVDVRTYLHDLELSSLMIELEREFGRERVVSEREMRSSDTLLAAPFAARPRFAVPLKREREQLTPARQPRLHFPDCAVMRCGRDDGILAIELERTAKGRSRLRGILSAYVSARHVEGVRYYVADARVRELVTSEIATLRAGALVAVRNHPGTAGAESSAA